MGKDGGCQYSCHVISSCLLYCFWLNPFWIKPDLIVLFPIPRVLRLAPRIVVFSRAIDLITTLQNQRIQTCVALRRCYELQASVLMFVVVPAHEFLRPFPHFFYSPKRFVRVVRAVLACPDQLLFVGVVVAHTRPTVAPAWRTWSSLSWRYHFQIEH